VPTIRKTNETRLDDTEEGVERLEVVEVDDRRHSGRSYVHASAVRRAKSANLIS
jgi:hypothetical protein